MDHVILEFMFKRRKNREKSNLYTNFQRSRFQFTQVEGKSNPEDCNFEGEICLGRMENSEKRVTEIATANNLYYKEK